MSNQFRVIQPPNRTYQIFAPFTQEELQRLMQTYHLEELQYELEERFALRRLKNGDDNIRATEVRLVSENCFGAKIVAAITLEAFEGNWSSDIQDVAFCPTAASVAEFSEDAMEKHGGIVE